MIVERGGRRPRIDATAYVSPDARIAGDVRIGAGCAVLAGAVLTSQGGAVTVGAHCVVMERAVLRGVPGHPCRLGDHVLVGPGAHLSGCEVEALCFLATGSTVLNGARIGRLAEVRINGVVHVRTRIPPEGMVPIGWVAVGDPAEILPPGAHDEIWAVQRTLGFRDAAFRMGDLSRERFMERMTRRYARALGRQQDDRPVAGYAAVADGATGSGSVWSSMVRRLRGGR